MAGVPVSDASGVASKERSRSSSSSSLCRAGAGARTDQGAGVAEIPTATGRPSPRRASSAAVWYATRPPMLWPNRM